MMMMVVVVMMIRHTMVGLMLLLWLLPLLHITVVMIS
jgi:hypothetical protein